MIYRCCAILLILLVLSSTCPVLAQLPEEISIPRDWHLMGEQSGSRFDLLGSTYVVRFYWHSTNNKIFTIPVLTEVDESGREVVIPPEDSERLKAIVLYCQIFKLPPNWNWPTTKADLERRAKDWLDTHNQTDPSKFGNKLPSLFFLGSKYAFAMAGAFVSPHVSLLTIVSTTAQMTTSTFEFFDALASFPDHNNFNILFQVLSDLDPEQKEELDEIFTSGVVNKIHMASTRVSLSEDMVESFILFTRDAPELIEHVRAAADPILISTHYGSIALENAASLTAIAAYNVFVVNTFTAAATDLDHLYTENLKQMNIHAGVLHTSCRRMSEEHDNIHNATNPEDLNIALSRPYTSVIF